MWLVGARIMGFQSFLDSEELTFAPGINLIIGQNNAGKSSVLRALLPSIPDDRHTNAQVWERNKLSVPRVELAFRFPGARLPDWIYRSGSRQQFPVPGDQHLEGKHYFENAILVNEIGVRVTNRPNQNFTSAYPSHRLFERTDQSFQSVDVTPVDGELIFSQFSGSDVDSLPALLRFIWERDMFYFAAERMSLGETPLTYEARLTPSASNLPNVLHKLSNEQGNLFRKLIGHLREIFPTVGNLSLPVRPDNHQLEVRVWPTEDMERVELSFPLKSSGTGVSQVIAILTAIMTIDQAVIIIDEINSFLHPAAVKALLRILQTEYSQHQYIISTHAPEVIGFANPSTIHLVRRLGYESTVEALDLTKVGKFREVAEHLGVSMADVFAAERVIWVEGPTEELCFPYLYRHFKGPMPRGTVMTSVAATGDFFSKRRDAELVFEVYDRLTKSSAALTPTVSFSFDRELLTEVEMKDMKKRARGKLHFLPRRHLECYLISPMAIAEFIVDKGGIAVTAEQVASAIAETAKSKKHLVPEWNGDISDLKWQSRVDAAKLITTVCNELSGQMAPFEKKRDTLFLLRHVVEHAPATLKGLQDYVISLVD